MALFEFHPQLKELTAVLERIARCLEIDVLKTHNIRLGHTVEKQPDPNPKEKPETTYATDVSALRAELLGITSGKRPDLIDDEEDEVDKYRQDVDV